MSLSSSFITLLAAVVACASSSSSLAHALEVPLDSQPNLLHRSDNINGAATTFASHTSFSDEDILAETFNPPLLKVLSPSNGEVLDSGEVNIEIRCPESLYSDNTSSQICINIASVHRPTVSNNIASTKPLPSYQESIVSQNCFSQQIRPTSVLVQNLLPGTSYNLRVLLLQHSAMLAASVRSFRVAQVFLPTHHSSGVSIQVALHQALQYHRASDFKTAAEIYQSILKEKPDQQDGLHLLGLVMYQLGSPSQAIPLVKQAIDRNATFQDFYNTLGLCQHTLGQNTEAQKAFSKALEINPDFVEANFNMGLVAQALGDTVGANNSFQKVIRDSRNASIISKADKVLLATQATLRSCSLFQTDQWKVQAFTCLSDGISHYPSYGELYHERGNIGLQLGKINASLSDFKTAASYGVEEALLNVAILYELLGDFNSCMATYDSIQEPQQHVTLLKKTRLPHVIPYRSSIVALDNIFLTFEENIEELLLETEFTTSSRTISDPTTIGFSTGFHLAFYNHNTREVKTNLAKLYSTYYPSLLTPALVSPSTASTKNRTTTTRRVGFISRFLHQHSIGRMTSELITQLSSRNNDLEIYVIGFNQRNPYDVIASAILKTLGSTHVVNLPEHSLSSCHQIINQLKLDVIVYPELSADLASYFISMARLAPVQAVWYGHPDTSGVPNIDYYLSSQYEDSSADLFYSESLYRMQGLGLYYTAPSLTSKMMTTNSTRDDLAIKYRMPMSLFHLYVCAQPLINLHLDFDKALKQILKSDRLAHVFFTGSSERSYWMDQFINRLKNYNGMYYNRVHFLVDYSEEELLTVLSVADVVLDGMYASGPIPSLNAFSLDVPVVTLPREFWRSRITYGMYREMGITNEECNCIASSTKEFASMALKIVLDVEFGKKVKTLIRRKKSVLFKNEGAIAEWERFLLS